MYKILVIEDDYFLRSNICEILTNEGYTADFAENGLSGLEKAHHFSPDLIISDIMMPELNGFEVLEHLMKDTLTASIPFIFLTAKAEPENLRKGMKLGADDYLFKPFNIDELLEAVKVRLKKKDLQEQKIKTLQEQISQKLPHELRTPLVPILGYAEMMAEEDDITQAKEMAKVIMKSGRLLHGRIEKFLQYKDLIIKENTKNRSETIKEKMNISEDLISRYLRKLPEELKASRVKINVEMCLIPVSEMYLETIIKELVENALKFSEINEPVKLLGYNEGGCYKIIVTDMGRGMKKDEIQTITAFRKFGENKFAENGLGLGLAIVQKIVELHSCNFSVKSELNKYTTCEISIPLLNMGNTFPAN